jgi:hypothetical protein
VTSIRAQPALLRKRDTVLYASYGLSVRSLFKGTIGAPERGLRSLAAGTPMVIGSVRQLLRSRVWPSSYSYLREAPGDVTAPRGPHGNWNDEVQGALTEGTSRLLLNLA